MLSHEPHRPLSYFRWIPTWSRHCSILSRIGASNISGAVHLHVVAFLLTSAKTGDGVDLLGETKAGNVNALGELRPKETLVAMVGDRPSLGEVPQALLMELARAESPLSAEQLRQLKFITSAYTILASTQLAGNGVETAAGVLRPFLRDQDD